MKAYVFQNVRQLTDEYHPGGGLMIVAADKRHARQLLEEYPRVQPTEDEWNAATVYRLVSSPAPRVWVFPDAGCC